MELEKSQILTLEGLILQSEIPYEDVKIELIDHLATEIEIRMESNPDLTLGDAIRLASPGVKKSIVAIKKDIEKEVITSSLISAFKLNSIRSIAVYMFMSVVAYSFFQGMGPYGAPIGSSIIGLTLIGFLIGMRRTSSIHTPRSLYLSIRKTYFWIPLIISASLCYAMSMTFIIIIETFNYWNYINNILLIPVGLAYGLLLKVILDVTVFNVWDMEEEQTLERRFTELSSSV